ncbi:MAG: VWA-like domain-containing protein [Erysipelotrichaceae bacterium]|nr:VWA-like domain-containing protein [Erysipelotrichaceae bacterium]
MVDDRINELALKILNMGKTQIILNLRFLDKALWQLKLQNHNLNDIATDGKYLYYEPKLVLQSYQQDQNYALRCFLHPLMHCLFMHMFIDRSIDQDMWDLACDMASEAMIIDLDLIQDPLYSLRKQELSKLKVNLFTAEKIYRYLMDYPIHPELLEEWKQLFHFDNHQLWYVHENQKGIVQSKRKSSKGQVYESSDEDKGASGNPENIKALWKQISEDMDSSLQTFSKQQGEKSSDFTRALLQLHQEHVDYHEFLKKFASRSEVMHASLDEFDYIYYTYGLELYKDTPLIEPLEYREDKKIRDFVIVIDTSGSVQGEMVQMFLQKTWNILKQQEAFDKQFNLHLIQCDSKIKHDEVITSQRELDVYLSNLTLQGFGGTDFRVAFEYVDELIKDNVFHHLKGLLYFTDGLGIYPKRVPSYLTAFVFVNNESAYYAKVPPWALQVVLEKEDLEIL